MQLSVDIVAERVRQEINERKMQGYVVNGMAEAWEQAKHDRTKLLQIHEDLGALPIDENWPYHEPSDLESIRAARPEPVSLPLLYLSEHEILHKIHGAWLGRIAGCILGKPFEMNLSQDEIKAYLECANAYPLSNYVPAQSFHPRVLRRDCVPSMDGYVEYAQEDDDLNYMCLAVKLLENHGSDFKSLDVGLNWLGSMPFLWTWGPEHVVYLNLAIALGEHKATDIDLEQVTSYLNPGIEWIGAQIRADVYGYVSPNNLESAAEFAWRDAYLTHRKSGLYGAMWVAAMNAAAFTLLDPEAIIMAGLSQIPKNSRFSECILQTVEWAKADDEWQTTGYRIVEHFDQYGVVGTMNNAACVAAALIHGMKDRCLTPPQVFEKTITTAVQLAYDTDCNGATAGSIVGLVLGAHFLPEKWVGPLNDTMRTSVVGFGRVGIAEMAQRTYALSRILHPRKPKLL